MAIAFLGLGGNVGDTRGYLARALDALGHLGTVVRVSSLYETEPVGVTDQPRFLNGAATLETSLPPAELLAQLKRIERELWRVPRERWGPREIDIDILLYDEEVVRSDTLEIPHPRLHERAFALVPLAEIAPEAVHTVLRKTVSELLQDIDGSEARFAGRLDA